MPQTRQTVSISAPLLLYHKQPQIHTFFPKKAAADHKFVSSILR